MIDFKGKHVGFELNTTDLKAAGAFYSSITAWVPRDSGMPSAPGSFGTGSGWKAVTVMGHFGDGCRMVTKSLLGYGATQYVNTFSCGVSAA